MVSALLATINLDSSQSDTGPIVVSLAAHRPIFVSRHQNEPYIMSFAIWNLHLKLCAGLSLDRIDALAAVSLAIVAISQNVTILYCVRFIRCFSFRYILVVVVVGVVCIKLNSTRW